jgi:hypothetical protein
MPHIFTGGLYDSASGGNVSSLAKVLLIKAADFVTVCLTLLKKSVQEAMTARFHFHFSFDLPIRYGCLVLLFTGI